MCYVEVWLYLVMKSGFRPRLSMLNMATSSPANLHTLTAMLAYTQCHRGQNVSPNANPATHSVSTFMPSTHPTPLPPVPLCSLSPLNLLYSRVIACSCS